MLKKIFLYAVILVALGCAETTPSVQPIKQGDFFPDLPLVSLDGEVRQLSDFKGKLVILNVWATWCAPCRKELPSLESLAKLLGDQRFAVFGLSIDDDRLLVSEYLSDKGIRLPIYFMREGVLDYAALGVNVFPYTFVITADGKLAAVYAGERVWNSAEMVEELRQF